MKRRIPNITLFLLLLLIVCTISLISCSGGGGGGGGAITSGGTTTNSGGGGGGGGGTSTQPAFSGFDFTLVAGNFWEYSWDYYENTWAQGSSPSTSRDAGCFWVVLGQPVSIQSTTAYEVLIYGKSKKRESTGTRTLGPRWKYVAIAGSKIYGSTDGSTLTMIFDAATGKWPGGGFFTTFPAGTLNIAANGTISSSNNYVSGTAVVAERSSSQSQCEYYPDTGSICGDSSYNYNEEEYYRAAIGPVGYYYYNTFSDCGGGFCSGATWKHNAGLTASSFTGQANPLINETEPNNSTAAAQGITIAHPVIGVVSSSDAGVTAPSTMVTDDNGNSVTISPTVEDWYSFTLASSATVTVTLSFEGSPTADLDMFLMSSAGSRYYGYSVHDNVARNDQHEMIVTSLTAGTYTIGIDGFATPAGPVKYTLQLE